MSVLSGFITLLLHPINLILMGFFFIKGMEKFFLKKPFKMLWLALILLAYFFSTRFALRPLTSVLEGKYKPLQVEELVWSEQYYIIVLGSGTGHDSRLPSTSLLSTGTLIRLVEGLRVIRKMPSKAQFVTSAKSRDGYRPQAFIARDAAIELGIDSNRITALPTAGNTHEEAEAFVKFAGKGAKVIVCTSAIHMPRAMEWFRRAGADPIAAPCDFIVKRDDPPPGIKAFIPQPELWKTWQYVLKEYLGLFYFKLKGA